MVATEVVDCNARCRSRGHVVLYHRLRLRDAHPPHPAPWCADDCAWLSGAEGHLVARNTLAGARLDRGQDRRTHRGRRLSNTDLPRKMRNVLEKVSLLVATKEAPTVASRTTRRESLESCTRTAERANFRPNACDRRARHRHHGLVNERGRVPPFVSRST